MSIDRYRTTLFYPPGTDQRRRESHETTKCMSINISYAIPEGNLVFNLQGRFAGSGYAYALLHRDAASVVYHRPNIPLLAGESREEISQELLDTISAALSEESNLDQQIKGLACSHMNDDVTEAIQVKYEAANKEFSGVAGSFVALSQRGRLQLFARIPKGIVGQVLYKDPRGKFPEEDFYRLTEPELKNIGIGLYIPPYKSQL